MASRFGTTLITNGFEDVPQPPEKQEPDEDDAMDAFSRVVIRVADQLRPRRQTSARRRNGGSGSASSSRRMGFC